MNVLYKLPEYEQHPVAIALMPGGMDDMEFAAFCGDVAQRGFVGGPITIYEGKVLDGWHRYRAAKKTSTAPTFKTYEGTDPAGYVASCNVLRRRLGSLQKALVAARLHSDYGITQREACAKLSTSNEVLSLVIKALSSKNTKLIKRIENDADFSRGMLKEELSDAGLLRQAADKVTAPTGPNSVFNQVSEQDEVASLLGDTDGIGEGLTADKKKRTRANKTEAQKLADEYQALSETEKVSFLTIIWPSASKLAPKTAPVKAKDPTEAWLKIEKQAASAKAKKDAKQVVRKAARSAKEATK